MKIVVKDDSSISDVQNQFNRVFPYLKIDFFSGASKHGAYLIKSSSGLFGQYRVHGDAEFITITPETTVSDLGKQFIRVYKLYIKVLRKSGKSWIETSLTESWTLEQQNREGRMLSGGR